MNKHKVLVEVNTRLRRTISFLNGVEMKQITLNGGFILVSKSRKACMQGFPTLLSP